VVATTRPLIADRLATLLARRVDRRGVLTRSALVGTALAAAPSDFILRPRSAYAAICRCSGSSCDCGSPCCDGYTEFCCTISGRNQCPPGSQLGGWWKVEGSSFCGSAPRYYLDCNAPCHDCGCGPGGICGGECSGTPCGCANGDCRNRKAGCVGFRYGQCNQQVACLGPIICRVVTCIPPWEIDGTCTTAVRTDENTRYHDAPCLRTDPVGSLDVVQRRPGGLHLAGWALDPDASGPIEVYAQIDGTRVELGRADRPRPDVVAHYPMAGRPGFDLVVPWTRSGPIEVCVFAVNQGAGGTRQIGCRQVPTSPVGSLDVVRRAPGGVFVAGWALDPETQGPVDVRVTVNGVDLPVGRADRPRPDVGQLYPQWGDAHGFGAVVPWEGEGTVNVCAYGVNVFAGTDTLLGCRNVAVSHTPFGALDVVARVDGGVRVAGWAIDPDTTAPVPVHVYLNGVAHDIGAATRVRSDVARSVPGWGEARGFDVVIPWSAPGPVDACAYAINLGAGRSNTTLGCRRAT